MKRLIILVVICFGLISSPAYSTENLPTWVFNSCQKQGDMWLFSGSVHDISILNVAMPLARNAALSNLASNIGITATARVSHSVEGSEVDGYTQTISVNHGYFLDRVVAYGVRQKEVHVERFRDNHTGRIKFNVHVLLEVSEADLARAKDDFSKHVYSIPEPAPIYKPKEEPGIISHLIRKVGL
jgi:hypothetical protein